MNYVQNEELDRDDYGFKWSLTAFCKHLESLGVDTNLLWSRIYDLIIKSIICGEAAVFSAIKKTLVHRTNCFELFGYDVMLDSDLKPWLIEINLSPSLACDSPLDMEIKSTLITNAFNLAGVKQFDRRKESENKAKSRMRSYQNKRRSLNQKFKDLFQPPRDSGLNGIITFNQIKNKRSQAVADIQADDFSQAANPELIEQVHILIEE